MIRFAFLHLLSAIGALELRGSPVECAEKLSKSIVVSLDNVSDDKKTSSHEICHYKTEKITAAKTSNQTKKHEQKYSHKIIITKITRCIYFNLYKERSMVF